VIPAATRYARASDVGHALELLADPDAKALAGGQSLIPVMKLRIARPSLVVDISRLELRGVEERDGALHIGPLTTWNELIDARAALARPGLEAVVECALGIGDLQVRNLGTIGGGVVHADPASDMPAVLLALGATLRVRSPAGERDLALADLLVGPFTTALAPQELVTDIVVPLPAQASGSAYTCVELPASGFALVGAAALAGPDGEKVALTGVGATPFAVPAGDPREAILQAEIFGDRFASAEYRRELAVVLAERALATARIRAQDKR
jgi:aerobic carbon-monoxide dehydrogenase medium subunit